jgi:tetratricopeptide (TPR) repeat protein
VCVHFDGQWINRSRKNNVSNLEQLLIEADQMIRKREYRQVIAAIEPLQKQWTAKPAEAPDVAPNLLFMLGSAYRGIGQRETALAALSKAAGMSTGHDDLPLQSAIMEVTADLFFEIGNVARAIEFSRGSLALACSDLLSKAQPRARGPRTENPRVVVKLASYLAAAGQWDEARMMLAIAREIFEARCEFRRLGQIFDALARLARAEGDIVKARKLVGEALSAKWIAGDSTMDQSFEIIGEKGVG